MHIILRRYAGAADRAAGAVQRAQAGLVPLLKAHRSFHGYAPFPSGQGDIASCSVCEDAADAARSADQVPGSSPRRCGRTRRRRCRGTGVRP